MKRSIRFRFVHPLLAAVLGDVRAAAGSDRRVVTVTLSPLQQRTRSG